MATRRVPPPALLALDGRELASLSVAEMALLQRYRKGLRRGPLRLPWVSVGFQCDAGFDPWAWLHAPHQSQRDQVLREAAAIVRIHVYD